MNIVWLENIGKNDVSIAGGKGAQLGELKKSGFPVPNGFIITTNVYKIVLSKIKNKVEHILSDLDTENTNELESSSNKIQSLILSIDLPDDIKKDIINYGKLESIYSKRLRV